MPVTRFPYGVGIGFENHFRTTAGTTAGLFTQSDATPNVSVGDLFIANNTGATTITYFDLDQYSAKAIAYQGKVVRVLVVDQGSTSFANAGQLYLFGTDNLSTRNAYALYEFVHFNSAWIQSQSAKQNRREVNTFTIGSAGSINVDDVSVAVVTGTAGTSVIRSLSGGQVGQILTLLAVGTGSVNHYVDTGGNIVIIGTNMYALNVSGAYQFIKRDASIWSMLTIGTAGIPNV